MEVVLGKWDIQFQIMCLKKDFYLVFLITHTLFGLTCVNKVHCGHPVLNEPELGGFEVVCSIEIRVFWWVVKLGELAELNDALSRLALGK
jgi:hypothetical protein